MNAEKLIEVTQHCIKEYCPNDCPFGDVTIIGCRERLMEALADKLEKAMLEIPKDCRTCRHIKKNIRELPCSACAVSSDNKDWEWRGDADG